MGENLPIFVDPFYTWIYGVGVCRFRKTLKWGGNLPTAGGLKVDKFYKSLPLSLFWIPLISPTSKSGKNVSI